MLFAPLLLSVFIRLFANVYVREMEICGKVQPYKATKRGKAPGSWFKARKQVNCLSPSLTATMHNHVATVPKRIFVCACVCASVRACERACVRECERASVRACVRACERVSVRVCARTHASVRVCVRVCVCGCVPLNDVARTML